MKALVEAINGRKTRKTTRKKSKMGSGKHLTFEMLAAQFGHGLKDAAARLGICPTTLKRACRRNGIERWPCRQIAKLNKTMNEMGYKGSPPKSLLDSAMKGKLKISNLSKDLCAPPPDGATKGEENSGRSLSCEGVDQNAVDPSESSAIEKAFNSAPASLGVLSDQGEEASRQMPSTSIFDRDITPQEGNEFEGTIRGAANMLHMLHRASSAPDVDTADVLELQSLHGANLGAISEDQSLGNCLLDFSIPSDNPCHMFSGIAGSALSGGGDDLGMADLDTSMDTMMDSSMQQPGP